MTKGLTLPLQFMIALFVASQGVLAQSTVHLGQVRRCTSCDLKLGVVVQLGTDSGNGMIESELTQAVFGAQSQVFGVFARRGSQVAIFDRTGRYLRTIGRHGRGPAEVYRLVDVQFSGDHVVMLDLSGRVIVADVGGRLVSEKSLRIEPASFRTLDDSTIVVGSMIRSRDLVGYPLHLVRTFTGEATNHFGSLDAEFSAAEPYSDFVILGVAPDQGRVWHGRVASLRLEEWNTDNRLLRSIRGDLSWFAQGAENQGGPRVTVQAFGVDSRDRLWIVTHVPDANWRKAPRHGTEGYVLEKDLGMLVDAQLDVFDMRSRTHLGRARFDAAEVSLTLVGSEVRLQRTVVDERQTVRVVLYGMQETR